MRGNMIYTGTIVILEEIGLAGVNSEFVLLGTAGVCLILFILMIVLLVQMNKLKRKYKKFMSGKDAKNLEKQIEKLFDENNYIRDLSEENKKNIRAINKEMELAFNKIGIVKYDAFHQMGGMLSFSIAILNEKNDGFLLNSVHSTEGCYTYTKEIRGGACEIELSSEEEKALAKAAKME